MDERLLPRVLRSFQAKLAVVFGLLILAGGLFTTFTSGRSVQVALSRAAHSRAHDLARDFAVELRPFLESGQLDRASAFLRAEAGHVGFVFVVRPDGRVLGNGPAGTVRHARRGGEDAQTMDGMAVAKQDIGPRSGTLWVGLSLAGARRAAAVVVRRLALWTALASLVGVLAATLLAALVTRPIQALVDTAERMGRGDLQARAPVAGRDELAHLATSFNRMAAQLQERIAQAEELRRYFEDVFEHVPIGIVVVDAAGRVRYANAAIRATFGDVLRRTWAEALGSEIPHESVVSALQSGEPLRLTHRSPSGRTYDVAATPRQGQERELIVTLMDVTEVTELAHRVRQAERLAVAGEVAAGIVHAINNPLDGVIRALGLAKRKPDDPERVTKMLEFAIEGTDRIATVTRMLLDFARAEAGQATIAVSPNALVDEALHLVTIKAEHAGIGIRRDLDPSVPLVRVEPHGIIEALLNLLLNGLDACEPGGQIVLTTRSSSATHVEVAVSDDGVGILPAHLSRIFEPFFTTKDAGKGTGLGLAVARRIVHANGGELSVESIPGEGATFRVRLPRDLDAAAERGST